MAEVTPIRRRWSQFSLGKMLAVVTAFAVYAAIVSFVSRERDREAQRKQEEIAEYLRKGDWFIDKETGMPTRLTPIAPRGK